MSHPSREDLATRIAGLSPAKRALLELKLSRKQAETATAGPGVAPIQRRAGRQSAELSFAQQRLWFIDQLEPKSPLYNMKRQIRIAGPVDIPSLQRALDSVVARHESLRTRFLAEQGRPRQVIDPAAPLTLSLIDLSDQPAEDREAAAQAVAKEVVRQPFDLEQGPLLRATLVRLHAEEHLLVLALHHIITDGWSMGVLFRDLSVLYQAYSTGAAASLPELPIQYADYAEWQREWLQGKVVTGQLDYWRDRLSRMPDSLRLPTDHPSGIRQSHEGTTVPIQLPAQLGQSLIAVGQREGATLFMTLLAAFKTLLWRYSGQEDVVVGTPIAGRTHTELEGLIGFFVNTLVMRTDLSGDPTFLQLLSRVREVALGAYANQDLPFERLVEEIQPERDLNRNPLFQIVFALHNAPKSAFELPGLTLRLVSTEPVTSKFDLALVLTEKAGEVRGVLSYSTDLFDATTIERMVTHLHTLLEAVAARPDTRISELPLLTPAEHHRVVGEWNSARLEPLPAGGLHQLFEEQVRRTPEAVALVADDQRLTYRELDRRASRLAGHLRALGVGPEARVGLIAERSPELLIGVLGILKAGGAYVPLDPSYPPERLTFMLEDSGATLLVAHSDRLDPGLLERLSRGVCVVVPVGDSHGGEEPAEAPPSERIDGESLAYVMYTSGSTGTPKGVGVPHRAVAAFSRAAAAEYGLTVEDRVLHLASISSDLSIDEIFPAWVSGAAVVLPAEHPGAGDELLSVVARARVTVLSLPTAMWHAWVQELTTSKQAIAQPLRLVIVGGEKAQPATYAAWRELEGSGIRWLNTYGPTETTVEATFYQPDSRVGVDRDVPELPIGRPLANAQAYVLDRRLNPVPIGVPGELCIGGTGVARGYLGRPGLTAAKFIPDQFGGVPGARLYRTGDRVRRRADGNLEFLDRLDRQVKVRGYRVEPGEVETALLRHPAVRECVVIAREDVPGDRRLVSYVVPSDGAAPTLGDLQAFLGGELPEHMIPTALVPLESLPLTPNGKIDRAALPPPDGVRPELAKAFRAPQSSVEETIAEIWRVVLKVDRVGLDDNFFALGGHSLLATQVVARVRAAFGIQLPLRVLFEAPTVAGLAEGVHAIQGLLDEVTSLSPAAVSAHLAGEARRE